MQNLSDRSTAQPSFRDLWGPREFADSETLYWRIGPLKLWLCHEADEWTLAREYTDDEMQFHFPALSPEMITQTVVEQKSLEGNNEEAFFSAEEAPPEDIEWYRIVAKSSQNKIYLEPMTPEKPLVVSAESPLKILPNNNATIYVNLPLNIKVSVGKGQENVLEEIPTVELSNTWFGSPFNGELSYALKVWAVRDAKMLKRKPNRAICPILVKNRSTTALDIQKLSIHAEHLDIYCGKSALWTNRINIKYLGPERTSEISIEKRDPEISSDGKHIGGPRVPFISNFFRKSFDFLKNLSSD